MRFRKKPVVIEAVQFTGDVPWPDGVYASTNPRERGEPVCWTLEGPLRVSRGDWIIKGVKGEFYPCKPDVFSATYEPADSPAPAPVVSAHCEHCPGVGKPHGPYDETAPAPKHDRPPRCVTCKCGWEEGTYDLECGCRCHYDPHGKKTEPTPAPEPQVERCACGCGRVLVDSDPVPYAYACLSGRAPRAEEGT